ncbi:hypothetical protein QR680_014922 [Steinernema hermaphroditum]|uniref:Uncharacterized protein n=1 Tax=Steinernema hermaphroditum TaxID=289476 RepID=A0AA39IAJ3_9BILA|nr:hypothetical protein QR680_014922 [Steinernema hermaphroditum]
MAASAPPNDFAFLSTDIIFHILKTSDPDIEDLEPFCALDGNWSDVVQSKDVFHTSYDSKEGYTVSDIGENGLRRCLQKPDTVRYRLSNGWNYKFDDVKVDIARILEHDVSHQASQFALQKSILEQCYGKVHIGARLSSIDSIKILEDLYRELSGVLDILLQRPISHFSIDVTRTTRMSMDRSTGEKFLRLIMSPLVRSVTMSDNVQDAMPHGSLTDFVKKPNFMHLRVRAEPSHLLRQTLSYWKTLTTFPNHMLSLQFEEGLHTAIRSGLEEEGLSRVHLRCNCETERESYSYRGKPEHSLMAMVHPRDETKRIVVISKDFAAEDDYDEEGFLELCLLSVGESQGDEWCDYSDFYFRANSPEFKCLRDGAAIRRVMELTAQRNEERRHRRRGRRNVF